ncbi:CPBP family intramembrane glutamic endopeptidase [Haloprofundus salilacus]|uniref:CPBP family intramembrane glutamic endopeptidase n=1 Tax=Haloprofundus salilacus TaxID=2876190 RepID=UPI001CCF0C10|nr:CPBP family intramembrane glutamic endopeptidase [Haloprofundus salilacus]
MADWTTFAGFAGVVLVLLLLLARASQEVVSDAPVADEAADRTAESDAPERPRHLEDVQFPGRVQYGPVPDRRPAGAEDGEGETVDGGAETVDGGERAVSGVDESDDRTALGELSTGALLANVALSQGLFAGLLLAGAWYAQIPASAFGVTASTTTLRVLGVGVAVGVVLYVANEAAATVGERFGLGGGEALREALAPDSAGGWVVLLLVVLPVVAGFEELLFRGALVGVLAEGFGVSPWLLALLSSVAFGLGHGAQGPVGVVVTGALGFALAAAFVLTESLLVVVVAHYLVNALEFAVHEGLGWEWTGRERTS